jgi:CubicO group peptidase (beta-lactamase class C family)
MHRHLLLFAFLAIYGVSDAQETSAPDWATQVDSIANRALTNHIAGISIAVAQDGQVILARGYGFANLEHSVPVTLDTPFHICSISKNIETAVLLQLVEQGKLSLDDDIRKYIPDAPTHRQKVTVAQLLNHTSGIFSFTSLPDADENERRELTHEQVLALLRKKAPDFKAGVKWRYNNSGFYIAGMIIERVTGLDYGAYSRQQIFEPLGMTSARMCDARMIVPHLASGYEASHGKLVNAKFIDWKLPFAAGAICATAVDLVKWQNALDSGKVLKSASLELMRRPTKLSDGVSIDYGLGTRLGSLSGHRVLGHTGGGGGFRTVLENFPDDHLTIVVLVNTERGPAVSIAADIARAVLRIPQRPLVDLPLSAQEVSALPGTYDSDEGPVRLFVCDGKLRCSPGSSPESIPLLRQAENIYAVDENSEVHFLVHNGHAQWGVEFSGGLLLDPKYFVK